MSLQHAALFVADSVDDMLSKRQLHFRAQHLAPACAFLASETLISWLDTGTFAYAKTEGKGNVYEGEFGDGVFDGQGANRPEKHSHVRS
jgi:hypothetical protein